MTVCPKAEKRGVVAGLYQGLRLGVKSQSGPW